MSMYPTDQSESVQPLLSLPSGGATVEPDGAMAPSFYGLAPPPGGACYSLAIKYYPTFLY